MDQHVIAEYREIRLLCGSFRKSLRSKIGVNVNRIPKQFTLMAGHILFFHDKGLYLHLRYELLKEEMQNRGWTPQLEWPMPDWPKHLYNNWTPQIDDYDVIRARIGLRISQKPTWYRYYGLHVFDSTGKMTDNTLGCYDWSKYFPKQSEVK